MRNLKLRCQITHQKSYKRQQLIQNQNSGVLMQQCPFQCYGLFLIIPHTIVISLKNPSNLIKIKSPESLESIQMWESCSPPFLTQERSVETSFMNGFRKKDCITHLIHLFQRLGKKQPFDVYHYEPTHSSCLLIYPTQDKANIYLHIIGSHRYFMKKTL